MEVLYSFPPPNRPAVHQQFSPHDVRRRAMWVGGLIGGRGQLPCCRRGRVGPDPPETERHTDTKTDIDKGKDTHTHTHLHRRGCRLTDTSAQTQTTKKRHRQTHTHRHTHAHPHTHTLARSSRPAKFRNDIDRERKAPPHYSPPSLGQYRSET